MPDRSSIPPPCRRCTALIVDPDLQAGADAAAWLRAAGFDARVTVDFVAARRALASAPPDVLVTALRLGAYNGLHLLMTARAGGRPIRGVLTGTHEDATLRAEAQRLAVGYLVKPISREMLLEAVRGDPAHAECPG